MKLDRPGAWVAALSLAAFCYGIAELFRDRIETGDIYPAYSTLRSDPMGCRAFFTALERYPGLTVKRAFARADFRGQEPGAAYLFLGTDAEAVGPGFGGLEEMDSLARQGQRVVIGFANLAFQAGDEYRMRRAGLMDGAGHGKSDGKKAADSASTLREKTFMKESPVLAARFPREWGLRMRIDTSFHGEGAGKAASIGNLKDTLPWLSGIHFDSLKGPWKVLYRRSGLTVAVERPLGNGSLALVSDSYFASNQAQFHADPARLAGALLGGSDRIFFDERHLGVRQDDAIASLLRRYRLHWILPSLLLLAALYIWKSRGAPASGSGTAAEAGEAPDTRSALAGLLRRTLPGRQALETCYALWKESAPRSRYPGSPPPSDPEIETFLESRKASGNPSLASGYAAIQAILNRRKRT